MSIFERGDGYQDAMLGVEHDIDHAYLYRAGETPEAVGCRDYQVPVRDSFISTYERVIYPKPPYSGTWNCRACSNPFAFGQLSLEGYCPADQSIHFEILARDATP